VRIGEAEGRRGTGENKGRGRKEEKGRREGVR